VRMNGLSGKTNRIAWQGLFALAVMAIMAVSVRQAVAQPAAARIYDEQLRVKLDHMNPEAREKDFDVGGWLNLAIFNYDDAPARVERNIRQYQLRAWASMNLQGVHRAYVRGLGSFNDWSGGTSNDTETSVERAWYQFDLGKLIEQQSGTRPPVGVRATIGRDFMTIGTALALSTELDMGKIEITTANMELMAFIGSTLRDSWNLDESAVTANRQQRWISGFELAYTGNNQHRPFVYYMHNNDNTDPAAGRPDQSYEYNSDYIGVGSTGTLLVSNLRYQVEGVYESGKTYSRGRTSGQDRIDAYAIDALIEYLFVDCPTKPRVGFEYLFASGDSDRDWSPISTDGGNLAGTVDHGFGAFGFRDLGIALAPEISNIHVYAINASFLPLEHIEMFEQMEVGTKLFFYSRAHGSGPISDTTTTNNSRSIGFEMDFFCNWRVTSDLALTVRYGSFFPGSAYDGGDKSSRQFLYGGMVFSF
jgi:hypothetical protein